MPMAVPDFQSLMLPLLRIAGDLKEHTIEEAKNVLALEFKLSEKDKNEMRSTGRQTRFDNRVRWAQWIMKRAGLFEMTGRGKFRVTERGQQVLKKSPARIDMKFLMQFPEFAEFRGQSKASPRPEQKDEEPIQTPEEQFESNYGELKKNLSQELLEKVKKSSPEFFERLVVDLLVAMGYGGSREEAGKAVGRTGDGGVDGIIHEDRLGMDVIFVQAKRWEGTVGRPVVQGFAGSLDGQRARKGVLITTSLFSPDARDYVEKLRKE